MNDFYNPKSFFGIWIKSVFFLTVFIASSCLPPVADAEKNPEIKVAFGKNCEKMLIDEINQSKQEMLVAIYSITRKSITHAFVQAAQRGVNVLVKYDAQSYKWKGMQQAIGYMKKRGVQCISINMSGKYAKMHNKFTVIDRKRVLTGSYNYTTSASIWNYENLVLLDSTEIADVFAAEFKKIKSK